MLISIVDKERSWFKSSIGTRVKENPRKFGLCSYVLTDDAPDVIVAPDLSLDNSVNHNPRLQHLRFFAAVISM